MVGPLFSAVPIFFKKISFPIMHEAGRCFHLESRQCRSFKFLGQRPRPLSSLLSTLGLMSWFGGPFVDLSVSSLAEPPYGMLLMYNWMEISQLFTTWLCGTGFTIVAWFAFSTKSNDNDSRMYYFNLPIESLCHMKNYLVMESSYLRRSS